MKHENNTHLLPVIALRSNVFLPFIKQSVTVAREKSLQGVSMSKDYGNNLVVVSYKDIEGGEETDNLFPFGVISKILNKDASESQAVGLLLQNGNRVKINKFIESEKDGKSYIVAEVEEMPCEFKSDPVALDLFKTLKDEMTKAIRANPTVNQEITFFIQSISDPWELVFTAASHLEISNPERQTLLSTKDIKQALTAIIKAITVEQRLKEIMRTVGEELRAKSSKAHTEIMLREQRRAIDKQLGEDEENEDLSELRESIEACPMPETTKKAVLKEFTRLKRCSSHSQEAPMIRSYLDFVVDLPWGKYSADNLDMPSVEKELEKDHYGLEDIKKRVLEFLAVRKLNKENKGPILCFVGPPGVGKTSLAKSIASALGRKFGKISLGAMHDESELRGHRKTYVAAESGKILSTLRTCGTSNPVIVLDELDKVGKDYRGDPSGAFLEILDPEQNSSFVDNYLNHPFDLSQVLFIATANMLETIHPALRDRLEIIKLSSYTEDEKREIARRHLVEKICKENGLGKLVIDIEDEVLHTIINSYTREAGVRELTQKLSAIARGVAKDIAYGKKPIKKITKKNLESFLKKPKYHPEIGEEGNPVGVATGLAWTECGGTILFVEAAKMNGTGKLEVTGNTGLTMLESAKTAVSWLKANSSKYGLEEVDFNKIDLHIHFPQGGVPKDGPSAGVTLVTALVSLFKNKKVPGNLAMTGEISLRGQVLPIGGLKEKLIAARRAGLERILIPKKNSVDLEEISEEIKGKLKIREVSCIEDLLEEVFSMISKSTKKVSSPPSVTV